VCGDSQVRVYIGGAQRKTLGNVDHAHVARPSRLQVAHDPGAIRTASCDASIMDSVKRSVFLCSKKISSAPRLNSANRGARASSRVETRRARRRRRSVCVTLLFSLTYQVVQHPTLYVGLYLSQLFMWDFSSHLLHLCSQKLGLHVTWALRFFRNF
jgi:hypothetical protein